MENKTTDPQIYQTNLSNSEGGSERRTPTARRSRTTSEGGSDSAASLRTSLVSSISSLVAISWVEGGAGRPELRSSKAAAWERAPPLPSLNPEHSSAQWSRPDGSLHDGANKRIFPVAGGLHDWPN